ncbi:MAG: DUF11 domain-containing protein [Actinomycetota bacterium]|nr:DUF11 domain-containing protein [Actinomycetota bacterium]
MSKRGARVVRKRGGGEAGLGISRLGRVLIVAALVASALPSLFITSASAAPVLTITPITWNVVGLDSNNVNAGANMFASGARVCNTGSSAATNVVTNYIWDTANANINLTAGSPSTLSTATLAAGSCFDFYYNLTITRTAVAYNTTRRYHITATADTLGTISTPVPREIFVEHLVSQNRNSVTAITGPGGVGDPPTTTVYVGQTYTYKLFSSTATNGYEQLTTFLNFPNVIFQVLSVNQTYTAPPGGTNDKIYADACGWDNVIASGTYRSCIGPNQYLGGKAGGTVVTTYVVKILSTGSTTISALIYDFSGSSYHYNNDFGVGVNSLTITAVAATDLSITKSDSPDPVIAGNNLTYTIGITNNGPSNATGVSISDPIPAGTSFVSASGGGTLAAGTVTWAVGALANGASTSRTLVVTVDPSRVASLSNTATVSSTTAESTPGNNSATEATAVSTSADLSITKSDSPDPVIAGNNVTYTLGITNNGPSDAAGVSISDPIPAGTTFVSASGGGTLAAGTVTWAIGALANGASTSRTLTVTVLSSRTTNLSNTATVSATTADPTPGNNAATEATTVNTSADLAITKSDSTDPVIAGNNLTYTLGITNNGPSDATGVSISDPIPAGTSFVSASGGGTLSAGVVTWAIGALASGGSTSRTLTVTVNSSRTTNLSNTAIVSATTTDPTPGNNSATETTTLNTSTDLAITKSDSPDPVIAGNTLTYTIGITNNGPSDATGVSISDPIPAGTSFVSASGGGTLSAGTVTWAIGALASGGSTSRTLTVTVNPSRTAALSNTATVSGDQSDPTPANNSATEATTVNTSADLSITKSDSPDPVIAGNNLTYTIDITNNGPSDATGVSISDAIPAGTTFVSASGGGTLAAGTVSWAIGGLASGASTSRTLTVTVNSSRTTDLSNTATVSATTSDPTPGNNSATETTTVNTSADVSITKSDSPDPVSAGNNLTYTIGITNNGPSDATGVSISDAIPAGTTFVAASGGGVLAAGTVTWAIGGLASGASTSRTLTVSVNSSRITDLSNTATVSATTTDPTPGNNSATETTTVNTSADLSITKSDSPDPVIAGNNLTYTIGITNNGPSDATGISVSDAIPAGTTFVSASGGGTLAAGTVTWSIGALVSGASTSRTLVVTVDPSRTADLSNTATVSGDQADPTPANNSATETTTVDTSADLSITKSDSPDPVIAGNNVTYTLDITNNGPSDATGVSISDPTPAGTTFVSASGGGSLAAGTVTWAIGGLANGASTSRTLTVSVDSSRTADLSNTATVSATTTDPTPANNSATETTTVDTSTDLSITKSDSPDPVAAGNDVTYTLDIMNNGPSDATGVSVSDPIPPGTTFVSASNGGSLAAGTVTWAIGGLASGASTSRTLVVTVDPSRTADLSNTAFVSGNESDPTPGNNSATETTTVSQSADLSITKSDSPDPVIAGNNLTYTIDITNNGPSDATGVSISDPIPAGTTFVSASGGGSLAAGTVTWVIGGLASGASTSRTLVVTVDPSRTADLSNTATVSGDQADATLANNSATEATTVDASADLSITKSDSPDPVIAGNNLTYTIGITNNGPSDATGVSVSDPIPAGTTFVSASGGGSLAAGTVTWAIGGLASGASTSRTLVVTVDPSRTADLSNTATVNATTTDPTPGNNDDTETTTVNTSADLSITKSDSPDPVPAGSNLTYTLDITNNGPSDATGVNISDPIPAGTTFVSASNGGSLAAGTVTWAIGGLASGGSASRTLVVTVDALQTADLSNTATVGATTADPTPGNNSDTETTVIGVSADLSITKSDSPDPVIAGNNLTYTIGITNNGPSDATGVSISDPIPAGTSFVSASNGGTLAAGTVTWAIGNLASGASRSRTLVLTVNPSRTADLSNTATVSADQADPTPANNDDTETTTVNTSADLSITKSDSPDPVAAGNDVTYTLDITNNGPSNATGVSISDPIPAGTTFVSASSGGTLTAGTVTWVIGNLASGASTSRTLIVSVDPSQSADLSNTATVSANETDPIPANNSATETTAVTQTGTSADLSITKSDSPDPAVAGATVTYTIVATNNGPDDATGVTVTDVLPAGLDFVSAASAGADCQESGGTVSCDVGNLDSGASVTINIKVTPTSEGTITNTATVGGDQTDPTPANNSATESTQVNGVSDLAVTKTASTSNPVEGNTIIYTIALVNNGPSDATGVVLRDLLPNALTFVSADAGQGTFDAATGRWDVGNLNNGDQVDLQITATVDRGIAGASILNHVRVAALDQTDPSAVNDVSSASVSVLGPTLPFTGDDISGLLIALVTLLLVGSASLWLGRRRAYQPKHAR